MAPDPKQGLKVLWATDGSDASRSAIPLLRRLVLPAALKLSVLTIAPQSIISGARPDANFLTRATPATRRRALLEAKEVAQRCALELDPGEIDVEIVSHWGNPIEEVLRAGRTTKADLIVLGAKGHSNLRLILLGSVSQGVVQHAARPVLVARPGKDRLDKVLVGFDGSTPARRAVTFLDRLKPASDVLLHLVSVVEPVSVPRGARSSYRLRVIEEAERVTQQRHAEAERSLASMAEQLEAGGHRVETRVLEGPVAPQLDHAALDIGADLIVVGSRKPSPENHYLLGGTAEKLVRHSHASVLVVR
jgi:nucleotide-binding universal stress UspA family protein